jgi:hypothetical protein
LWLDVSGEDYFPSPGLIGVGHAIGVVRVSLGVYCGLVAVNRDYLGEAIVWIRGYVGRSDGPELATSVEGELLDVVEDFARYFGIAEPGCGMVCRKNPSPDTRAIVPLEREPVEYFQGEARVLCFREEP